MEEDYIKSFISNMHCGFCGKQCIPDNIDLMERDGDYWVFSVYCDSCKKQGYVTAVVQPKGEVPFHPELNIEELKKFGTPVSSDEILGMHSFLGGFDGDFSLLFTDINVKPAEECSSEQEQEIDENQGKGTNRDA